MTLPGLLPSPGFDVLQLQYPICDVHVELSSELPVRADETNPARSVRLTAGGGATTVFTARRLGLTVSQVGVVGADAIGNVLVDEYEAEGADTSLIERRQGALTPCAVVLSDPSGAHGFASILEGDLADEDVLRHAVERARAVSVSGYMLRDPVHAGVSIEMAAYARRLGRRVFFDPGPLPHDPALFARMLETTDVLVLSRAEATYWSACGDEEGAAEQLRSQLPPGGVVVVKRGGDGCLVHSGHRPDWHAALDVEVRDTTGAGDAFLGALMAGLAFGWDIGDAATLANAAGAATCVRVGSGSDAGTRAEICDLLRRSGRADLVDRLRPASIV